MKLTFPLKSAFLALPLEEKAKAAFRELQDRLQPYEAVLRFQNPSSPHLTLIYWPELLEIEYTQIIAQAEKIAEKTEPFPVRIMGAETFGSRGEDRVLHLTLAFSDELARLKKACPWPNTKPFVPHITLARIRHPQRFRVVKKKVLKLLKESSFEARIDRLRLYAEIEGKKQTQIADFPFTGAKKIE
jgi:2'-5' RNA ligase